ncbi:GH36-type glycosyl hydrolase domain-containing protein [Nonomuraea purpurea]|uniref:GH36-type glycosyl hydrolase domain-containing protein n=1 Tax=Nonomuraea purpurea TaxID=1849276 RepID=A0ABV8G6Y9_9ACTN
MSAYGEWTTVHGLPAFAYTLDQERDSRAEWDPVLDPPTRRHVAHMGNRRITLVSDNYGLSDLFDEHTGLSWLTRGTGVTRIGGLSTDISGSERVFGPTYAIVRVADERVALERTVLCPEGEQPWVLIRLRVRNLLDTPVRLTLTEEWATRAARAELITGAVDTEDPGLELELIGPPWTRSGRAEATGKPTVRLSQVESGHAQAMGAASARFDEVTAAGALRVEVAFELGAGGERVLDFRCGLLDPLPEGTDLGALFERSLEGLRARLPRACAAQAPEAEREIPWHAALLTGAACADGVLGGHTLDQGSCYSFRHGFNGAARDPLQHALPLVYIEPDLALSVLRNTCAWGGPDGDLPYALGPDKKPWTDLFRPSDQNLWALWLAAEYLSATGDEAAFRANVPYHPIHEAPETPLQENLRRQFRFLADVIGRGEHGHLRILNADWNDLAVSESGVPREVMIAEGESVLNSAMAAWVLPRYARLAERLGDAATAAEARKLGEELRELVAGEWNGRWYRRAYGPGAVVGDDDLWLEVQPWAVLCGAAPPERAVELLRTIERTCAAESPLGARLRWPPGDGYGPGGVGTIWYAINMTLVWAAAEHLPELAWDWWRRMTLAAHTAAYPDIWEGTLSGPDAYLAPETGRPGRTWDLADVGVAMQAYPVANLHSHSQPLLAYLRLLGVEPFRRPRGGARFASRVLEVGS